MHSPKIVLYGDFAWPSLGSSFRRGFAQAGYEVTPFDAAKLSSFMAPWLRQRLVHRLMVRNLAARRAGSLRWNNHLLETIRSTRPDLLLVLKGELVMPETIEQIRQYGTKVFIFHPDNPFPPHHGDRPETLPCALASDGYFIWSEGLVEQLTQFGVKNVAYLPFAWDAELFPYREMAPQPQHDVIFIGGWDKEREDVLTLLAGHFNVKVWGPPYWNTRTRINSPLRKCWQGYAPRGAEVVDIIADARVVLNVLRVQNLPDGVIMRTFEVPGSGGFLLSTRTSGATKLFPEGEAGGYFGDLNELVSQVEAWLSADQKRREVAARAHELVAREHTYQHRARSVLDLFNAL